MTIAGSSFRDAVKRCARDPGRRCEKQALVPPCVDEIVDSAISAGDQAQQVIRSAARMRPTLIVDNLKRSDFGTA